MLGHFYEENHCLGSHWLDGQEGWRDVLLAISDSGVMEWTCSLRGGLTEEEEFAYEHIETMATMYYDLPRYLQSAFRSKQCAVPRIYGFLLHYGRAR